MSAIIKPRHRKNLTASTAALWIVLGLAATFFLVSYGQELILANDLADQAARQRAVNSTVRDENARLRAQLQYYQSDKYIEQRAREDLNLRGPDEIVLIPVEQGAAAANQPDQVTSPNPPQANAGADSSAAPTPTPANWQKWLGLFAPGP